MGNSTRDKYSYYVEQKALDVTDRPRKFLEAFAAVLEHSNYGVALETYSRLSAKCGRCAASCQLYEDTQEERDIPCFRSELLIEFPFGTNFKDYSLVFSKAHKLRPRFILLRCPRWKYLVSYLYKREVYSTVQ